MIECELCGNYFHPDEINDCPNCNCTLEICERCYEMHVPRCMGTWEEDEIEDEIEDDE